MVLFYMPHLTNLYQFLTLKFTKYSHQDVVLLTFEAFAKSAFARRLAEEHVFVKIAGCIEVIHDDEIYRITGNRDWKKGIQAYFDKILSDNSISIEECTDILISCDMSNNFFLYCCFQELKASFIESYENQFDDRNRYGINRKYGKGSAELEKLNIQFAALTGESQNVIKRYRFGEENKIINEVDENVDFLREFYELPQNVKEILKSIFEIKDTLKLNGCSVLLLNSIGYSVPLTKLEGRYHYYPYLLIADYYLNSENNIIFKDHPMTAVYFGTELLNAYVGEERQLNPVVPIEIYALADNFRINKLISVHSTGNVKISRFIDKEITIGDSYLVNFRIVHRLFTVFSIDAYIGKSVGYHYYGISKEFLCRFREHVFMPFEDGQPKGIKTSILKGNIFTIIDQIPENETENIESALTNADLDTKVMFLDSDKIHNFLTFCHAELLEYFIPINISKYKLKENILSDTEDETIWFFCKNREIREKVCGFSMKRKLEYTGIEISAASVDRQLMENKLLKLRLGLIERQIKLQQAEITELGKLVRHLTRGVGEEE